ncbi:MAG: hypothetical protein ACRC0L_04830, partial [Angustibacter sp.]
AKNPLARASAAGGRIENLMLRTVPPVGPLTELLLAGLHVLVITVWSSLSGHHCLVITVWSSSSLCSSLPSDPTEGFRPAHLGVPPN